jgi:hypothetical protein
MLRSSLVALAAAAGLLGASELGTGQARADTIIRIGIGTPHYCRPVYPVPIGTPVVVTPAPIVTAPVIVAPAHCCYEVFYRDCVGSPWRMYGSFGSHYRAHEVVASLRAQGFRAYIAER